MPKGRHEPIQNFTKSALNDSNRALICLDKLRDAFRKDHPEYLPLFDALGQIQLMFQISLGDFFKVAWGRRPAEFPVGFVITDVKEEG